MQLSAPRSTQRFSQLLPRGVVVIESMADAPAEALTAPERALVATAIPKRIREFTAGRWCARSALSRFGITGFSLLADQKRAPVWPAGMVGSITHAAGFCAAAVGQSREFSGIGIDAEESCSVASELWNHLFTIEEIAWLRKLPDGRRGRMATVLFSAKESFYKCQYSFTKDWLDFTDVRVVVEGERWRVTLPGSQDPPRCVRTSISGRFTCLDGLVLTAIVARPAQLRRLVPA